MANSQYFSAASCPAQWCLQVSRHVPLLLRLFVLLKCHNDAYTDEATNPQRKQVAISDRLGWRRRAALPRYSQRANECVCGCVYYTWRLSFVVCSFVLSTHLRKKRNNFVLSTFDFRHERKRKRKYNERGGGGRGGSRKSTI